MIIPTIPMTRAPAPSSLTQYPWRYRVGENVFVKYMSLHDTFTVVGGELLKGWPHYILFDCNGQTWRIPQMHCASKPLLYRKG